MRVKSDKTDKSGHGKSYVSLRIVNCILQYITTSNLSLVIRQYCNWINQKKTFIHSLRELYSNGLYNSERRNHYIELWARELIAILF